MTSLHQYTDPARSVSVMASAGTGKTYLLIKRLARIMLYEHQAESILALTFSNRAVAELRTRLHEEVVAVSRCTDDELNTWLTELGETPNDDTRTRARSLYRRVLERSPVIISTFHGFCHDLVTRFALHNGRDSSFQVVSSPKPLMLRARIELLAENNQEFLAQAGVNIEELQGFLDHMGSDYSFERVLGEIQGNIESLHLYLKHYEHDGQVDLEAALAQVRSQELPEPKIDLANIHTQTCAYCDVLQAGGTATGIKQAASFARHPYTDLKDVYLRLRETFMTQKGEWRKKLYPAALADQAEELESGLKNACTEIETTLAQQQAIALNATWLKLGWCYLQTFQRIKTRHRLIDFDDMQTQAWELLHRFEDHSAIQHKLSSQIRHILIDEFQDTSLLQWSIVLPFVNEIVCQKHEHRSSVFIIGDGKQMIYRFRGAEISLFGRVCQDLENDFGVKILSIDHSWRTGQNILDWVNTTFGTLPLNNFRQHHSARPDLWSAVVCLPFISDEDEDGQPDTKGAKGKEGTKTRKSVKGAKSTTALEGAKAATALEGAKARKSVKGAATALEGAKAEKGTEPSSATDTQDTDGDAPIKTSHASAAVTMRTYEQSRQRWPAGLTDPKPTPPAANADGQLPEFADPFNPAPERLRGYIDPSEYEAEQVVAFLCEMHSQQLLIDRKDGPPTPMQWGDVMILSRRRKPFTAFERVFRRCNVRLQVVESKASHAPYAWRTLVALLQTLLNPCDDIALLTVLCSPLFDLREEELLHLAPLTKETRRLRLWQRLQKTQTQTTQTTPDNAKGGAGGSGASRSAADVAKGGAGGTSASWGAAGDAAGDAAQTTSTTPDNAMGGAGDARGTGASRSASGDAAQANSTTPDIAMGGAGGSGASRSVADAAMGGAGDDAYGARVGSQAGSATGILSGSASGGGASGAARWAMNGAGDSENSGAHAKLT
ncbi:MAG: UvrD-helicase domain-containing protein, partial [Gammaproteobacteria bacterium]|nr:UvrD-helicase domain-containing protein [Gammaproteobacteria bacterium]